MTNAAGPHDTPRESHHAGQTPTRMSDYYCGPLLAGRLSSPPCGSRHRTPDSFGSSPGAEARCSARWSSSSPGRRMPSARRAVRIISHRAAIMEPGTVRPPRRMATMQANTPGTSPMRANRLRMNRRTPAAAPAPVRPRAPPTDRRGGGGAGGRHRRCRSSSPAQPAHLLPSRAERTLPFARPPPPQVR